MTTTAAEIVAYIGAAAWLPQVVRWLYHKYSIPNIIVVPDKKVSIGYTVFGPIFNLNLALSSSRSDALIHKFDVSLYHKDGDVHKLSWQGMSETVSEIKDSTGNRQTISKEESAIAFKIGTSSLFQKFVRFQDPSFFESTNNTQNKMIDRFNKLQNSTIQDPAEATIKSSEFEEFIKQHSDVFWWKPGKYKIIFHLDSPNIIKVKKHEFSFVLNQKDIDHLKRNFDIIKNDHAENLRADNPSHKRIPYDFNWVHPVLVDDLG